MLHPRPHRSRRWSTALLAVLGLFAGTAVYLAPTVAAAPTPPPNPTDQQLADAQASKSALATQVGDLTAQLNQLQAQVDQLQAAAELAEQKVALALQQLQDAQDSATAAKQSVVDAQSAVDAARKKFNSFVRLTYQSGSLDVASSALLTSPDPSSMLQSTALQTYVANHQIDGIGELNRATVAKSNADAVARAAVATQTKLTQQAKDAQTAAVAAAAAATAQKEQTDAKQVVIQAQLDTAQATLLGLQNQRGAYDAWKAEQARIAAAAEAARQAQILAAQQLAARNASASRSSGSSSGSGTTASGNPTGGTWSAARAQDAVNRAMAYKGTRYSWAAGNYNGPTFGQCGSGDAGNNDCHVYGFDCSGLMLYAWAPYIHLVHYAATQYAQAGQYHPGTGDLQPGDLVFWSSNGAQSGIHHVAMYIGGGNVLQAPQSGDVVKITNLWNVTSGYYGATRPLT